MPVAVIIDGGGTWALHNAEVGGVVRKLASQALICADVENGIAVALRIVRALRDAVTTEIICKSGIRTFLHASVGGVLSEVSLRTDLDASLGGGVGKGLHRKRILALVPANATIIIGISNDAIRSYKAETGRRAGSSHVLPIRVDFDGAETSAQGGRRVSIVAHVADGDASLAELAAEVAA